MEQNSLVWVNDQDEIVGYGEKMETHRVGQLHRAYSIFIYDRDTQKVLLQKRAKCKYHSGGLWSNACCSHPYKGETWEQAIRRGVQDELGIFLESVNEENLFPDNLNSSTPLQFLGRFQYYSNYGELSEHEMDSVFLFMPDKSLISKIVPNPNEIESLKWMSISEIDSLFQKSANDFTSWFYRAYQFAKQAIEIIN